MATMYLMVGISGAGKTTWAKTRLAGAEYIGSDSIRMELFGKELTLKGYHRAHRIMNQRMCAALEQGRDVVVDSVHLSRRARRRVLRAVPEGVRCVAVWIDTGVMQAIRNDACRQRHVPFLPSPLCSPGWWSRSRRRASTRFSVFPGRSGWKAIHGKTDQNMKKMKILQKSLDGTCLPWYS